MLRVVVPLVDIDPDCAVKEAAFEASERDAKGLLYSPSTGKSVGTCEKPEKVAIVRRFG